MICNIKFPCLYIPWSQILIVTDQWVRILCFTRKHNRKTLGNGSLGSSTDDDKDGSSVLDLIIQQTSTALKPKCIDGLDDHTGKQIFIIIQIMQKMNYNNSFSIQVANHCQHYMMSQVCNSIDQNRRSVVTVQFLKHLRRKCSPCQECSGSRNCLQVYN